jgi:hypothetical protein
VPSSHISKNCCYSIKKAKTANAIKCALPGFVADPLHFLQLVFATQLSPHGTSYNSYTSETWKVLADNFGRQCLTNTSEWAAFKCMDPWWFLIEQYVYLKELIMNEINPTRREEYNMPFMSFNIDLIKDKGANTKYLGLRVSYMNISLGNLCSHTLAIREYNPTWHEANKTRASDLLVKWVEAILTEYGIDPK